MNQTIDKMIRSTLLEKLTGCREDQQVLFKRMYSGGCWEKSVEDVVNSMPADKLDWAMTQVEQTLEKNGRLATP